jgi:adenosylcobinamide-phosphate synthase
VVQSEKGVCGLGLPGAALYRFANTADAMWGYRGEWEWAGKFAARADDLLSWLPARLTAWMLWLCCPTFSLTALRDQARKTPSPNAGWPMAALALGLRGLRVRDCTSFGLSEWLRLSAQAPEARQALR